MRTSETTLNKIKEFEGLRLVAYRRTGDLWTIGYGHTRGVRCGQVITPKEAEQYLESDLMSVEKSVGEMFPRMTQGQFDALVDFAFNLGVGRLRRSTLARLIRRGAPYKDICAEFQKWKYFNGVPNVGLERRRTWEAMRYGEK